MKRVEIKPTNWSKVFALVGKLVRYAKGGFTHAEKLDLVIDLMDCIGALSEDIAEDIQKDVEERDAERKEEDK